MHYVSLYFRIHFSQSLNKPGINWQRLMQFTSLRVKRFLELLIFFPARFLTVIDLWPRAPLMWTSVTFVRPSPLLNSECDWTEWYVNIFASDVSGEEKINIYSIKTQPHLSQLKELKYAIFENVIHPNHHNINILQIPSYIQCKL